MQVSIESVERIAKEALTAIGVEESSIEIIVDTILFANRRGKAPHGIGRLPLYVQKIQAGHLNPKDCTEKIMDSGAVALFDARNGFGQVAAMHALNTAFQKATEHGISAVGVRNGNNFGMAGYFGNIAAQKGFAALIFANAAPAIAPTGGKKTIFGTNPVCFSFPGVKDLDPLILDMASTVTARGKIRLAAKNGEKIPLDWAIGPDGKPTDDPNEALLGALLPIGGYKGYGLAMFVDLFAGLLTGSAYAGNVKNLNAMDQNSGNGNLFIVIDLKRFMTSDEYEERMTYFHQAVKACGEDGEVFMPGERGFLSYRECSEFVELSSKQIEEIHAIAKSLGIKSRLITS